MEVYMDNNWLARVEPIYTIEGIKKLKNSRVVILGLGGVGSAAAEAICRSGVENIMLVDSENVNLSNINRQIIATRDNIGKKKTLVAKERLLSINPNCNIEERNEFYLPENSSFVFDFKPDYIVDAIDTVTAKLHLALNCYIDEIPLISCLGTGNRLDPSKLVFGDISMTSGTNCPLARIMRRELRRSGVKRLDVVFSTEPPFNPIVVDDKFGRHAPASTAFVPPSAGFLIASVVIREILGIN